MKVKRDFVSYGTYVLIILNLLAHFWLVVWGGSDILVVLEPVALNPEKVLAGEWWRIFTANFFHLDIIHLLFNMLSLYYLGDILESRLGAKFVAIVYSVSGVGAKLVYVFSASILAHNHHYLVGASSAIMGLAGAYLVVVLRAFLDNRSSRTAKLRLIFVSLLLLAQFTFDNIVGVVSFHAHLFGFIVGFLVSSVMISLIANPQKI